MNSGRKFRPGMGILQQHAHITQPEIETGIFKNCGDHNLLSELRNILISYEYNHPPLLSYLTSTQRVNLPMNLVLSPILQ